MRVLVCEDVFADFVDPEPNLNQVAARVFNKISQSEQIDGYITAETRELILQRQSECWTEQEAEEFMQKIEQTTPVFPASIRVSDLKNEYQVHHRFLIERHVLEPKIASLTPGILALAVAEYFDVIVTRRYQEEYKSIWEHIRESEKLTNELSILSPHEFSPPNILEKILRFISTRISINRIRLLLIFLLSIVLTLLFAFIFHKIFDKTAPLYTKICPPSFEESISFGDKILKPDNMEGEVSYRQELSSDELSKASENIKEGCNTLIHAENKEGIQTSVDKFTDASSQLQSLRDTYPTNAQIFTYLNNAKLLYKHAQKALDSPQEYSKTDLPHTIAVTVPINVRDGEQELIGTSNQINLGVAIAQENFNNQPNSRGFLLLIADDKDDDTGTPNQPTRLIKDIAEKKPDIVGVIGHYKSSVSKSVIPKYNEKKIILISATSTAVDSRIRPPGVSPENNYFFRVVFSDDRTASEMVKYLKQEIQPPDKVAIVYKDDAYGQSLSNEIQQRLHQPEWNVVLATMQEEESKITSKIKDAKAVVLIPNGNTEKIYRLTGAREIINKSEADYEQPIFISGDSMFNSDALVDGRKEGHCAKGLIVFAPDYHSDFLKHIEDKINQKGKQTWKTQNWRIAYAHDATLVLLELASQEEVYKPIPDRLYSEFGGLKSYTGDIFFDENGDRRLLSLPGGSQNNVVGQFKIVKENNQCKFERVEF